MALKDNRLQDPEQQEPGAKKKGSEAVEHAHTDIRSVMAPLTHVNKAQAAGDKVKAVALENLRKKSQKLLEAWKGPEGKPELGKRALILVKIKAVCEKEAEQKSA